MYTYARWNMIKFPSKNNLKQTTQHRRKLRIPTRYRGSLVSQTENWQNFRNSSQIEDIVANRDGNGPDLQSTRIHPIHEKQGTDGASLGEVKSQTQRNIYKPNPELSHFQLDWTGWAGQTGLKTRTILNNFIQDKPDPSLPLVSK